VPKLAYPWTLSAQRFDANGSPRTSDTVVAKDIAGDNFVTWIAGTVTTTGWILVVWSSFDSPDPNSAVAQAAWISPSGDVRRAQPFGKNGDRIGVIPLVEGGAAVALTPPGVPAIFEWTAVFKDGSVTPEPAGWLGQFPDTRIALVRNKRAYAVFQSSPYPASTADEPCASTVSLDLMSGAGTECGKLSVPALLEPDAACVGSATSLAVTADGTLVARTIEQSQDVSGATRFHSQARWWPHLLK
jgi:hypothetical protein